LLHEKLVSAWLIVGPFRLIDATRSPAEWADPPVCHLSIRTLAMVISALASVTTLNWYARTFGSVLAHVFTPSERQNDTSCDVISVPTGWFGPKGAAVVNEPVIDMADV